MATSTGPFYHFGEDVPLRTFISQSREKVFHKKAEWCFKNLLTRHSPVNHAIKRADEMSVDGRDIHVMVDCMDEYLANNGYWPSLAENIILSSMLLLNRERITPRRVRDWTYPRYHNQFEDIEQFKSMALPYWVPDRPNLWDYVEAVSREAGSTHQRKYMAYYFAEMVQFNGGIDGCTLGLLACLCVFFARLHVPPLCENRDQNFVKSDVFCCEAWRPEMVDKTGVALGDFEPHIDEMCRVIRPYEGRSFSITGIVDRWRMPGRADVGNIPLLSPDCIAKKVRMARNKETLQLRCRNAIRHTVHRRHLWDLPLPPPLLRMLE